MTPAEDQNRPHHWYMARMAREAIFGTDHRCEPESPAAQLGLAPCVQSQSLLQSDAARRRAGSTGAPPPTRPRSGRCNLSRPLLTDVMLWSGWHAGVSSKTPEQFMGGTEDRFGVSCSVIDEYNIYNM